MTVRCLFDGEIFIPRPHQTKALEKFVAGQIYPLEMRLDRSTASHKSYFAQLHDAWENLPDAGRERFPTVEHLRKYALIRAGFRDERSIACPSEEEALKVAAFINPMNEYAVVVVMDALVVSYTAKSQDLKSMDRKEFQASKNAVLDYVTGLLGITREALANRPESA